MNDEMESFSEVKSRLDEIVEEVAKEDISLDDALSLYEEAVKLGLGACNLSESDIFPEEFEEVEATEADKVAEDATAGVAEVTEAATAEAVEVAAVAQDEPSVIESNDVSSEIM